MNGKAKGTKNEHRTMKLLEKRGFKTSRSAASLGEWDVIGIGPEGFVLVQVKTGRWPGSVEMARLHEFRCPENCLKLIHRWMPRQREPETKIIP